MDDDDGRHLISDDVVTRCPSQPHKARNCGNCYLTDHDIMRLWLYDDKCQKMSQHCLVNSPGSGIG